MECSGHAVHCVLAAFAYLPASHRLHSVARLLDTEPSGQASHSVRAAFCFVPAKQNVHVMPLEVTAPSSHRRHFVEPALEAAVPAAHAKHGVRPVALYVPAKQSGAGLGLACSSRALAPRRPAATTRTHTHTSHKRSTAAACTSRSASYHQPLLERSTSGRERRQAMIECARLACSTHTHTCQSMHAHMHEVVEGCSHCTTQSDRQPTGSRAKGCKGVII